MIPRSRVSIRPSADHSFKDIPDLLSQLDEALGRAADALQPVAPRPLTSAIVVPWRGSERDVATGIVLETHVIPVGPTNPLPFATFSALTRTLARAGQDLGLFDDGQALDFLTTETSVAARSKVDARRPEGAVRVGRDRIISVWEGLPSQTGVFALDESYFRSRIARDLRLAARLELTLADRSAIAIGLGRIDMLGIPSGSNAMTLPFAGRGGEPVQLEPTESWPTRALAVGADDVAAEHVARLMLRLMERR